MSTTRLVTLAAAATITAAESLLFLWALAPARVQATPLAMTACVDAIPEIVVTAHRDRGAHWSALGQSDEPSRQAAAASTSAGDHVHR